MNRSNLNPRRLPLAALILTLVAGPAAVADTNKPVRPATSALALPGAILPASADTIPAHAFINCNDDGPGSLRQAIADAASGEPVIASPELACSTITLASPLTFGQHDLSISGLGASRTIITAADGVNGGLINHIGSGQLVLQGLTLTGGHKYNSSAQAKGGCVYGANNVAINNARITHCVSKGLGSQAAVGGGVFSEGLTSLRLSEVSGNVAMSESGTYTSGGGMYAVGGVDMDRSVVAANAATSVTNSWGGGFTTPGTATIANSAIVNNSAITSGGAHIHPSSGSVNTITNTTVSGNSASRVGGLTCIGGTFTIASSTITANKSTDSEFGGRLIGGGLDLGSGTHTIVSTIITGNLVGTDSFIDSVNLSGSGGAALSASGTHNRISHSTLALPSMTNITPVQMEPLALNGSTRPTHTLRANPADIDWGIAPAGQTYDQRGAPFLRTVGSAADVGAFEYDPDYVFRDGFDASIPTLPPAS